MAARPRISVVMPTYNRPSLLRTAVESVLGQTCRDFELIVVNDAGEDVKAVLERYADERIVFVAHEANKGLPAARNTALRAARGAFISYLDDDDIYYPEHLETLSGTLEKSGKEVCFSKAYRVVQKRTGDGEFVTLFKNFPFRDYFDRDLLLVNNYIPVNALMHRRECVERCGYFDEALRVCEDWDFLIRLSRTYDFRFVDAFTSEMRWRLDNSNMTGGRIALFKTTFPAIYERYRSHSSGKRDIVELQERVMTTLLSERRGGAETLSEFLLLELSSSAEACYGFQNSRVFRLYDRLRRYAKRSLRRGR